MKFNITLELSRLDFEDHYIRHGAIALARRADGCAWYVLQEQGNRVTLVPFDEAEAAGLVPLQGGIQ